MILPLKHERTCLEDIWSDMLVHANLCVPCAAYS